MRLTNERRDITCLGNKYIVTISLEASQDSQVPGDGLNRNGHIILRDNVEEQT